MMWAAVTLFPSSTMCAATRLQPCSIACEIVGVANDRASVVAADMVAGVAHSTAAGVSWPALSAAWQGSW